MNVDNYADRLRREILIRVAKAVWGAAPEAELDHIAVEMRPRTGAQVSRCCIYKDRALIKYRCQAALGFGMEDETDETKPVSAYYREAMERTAPVQEILTVLDEACTACVRSRYMATDACRGCIAHPCLLNCPKQAIEMRNGQAYIRPEKCVNCGLCMNACPYHAIIRVPIPCEEACPVGAISKSENGRVSIDFAKCMYCGKCAQSCPFAAIVERSQMLDVMRALKGSEPVVALLAPSAAGQFPGTWGQLRMAVSALGFVDVMEVAAGAEETVALESVEFVERMEKGEPFMTSSCCPAFVETIRRHIPELLPRVSTTPSPMVLSARRAKARWPGARTVFMGPCLAKRWEARDLAEVDDVLTFEELGALLAAAGIDVARCEEEFTEKTPCAAARGFAASGGVARAIQLALPEGMEWKPVLVDGLDRKSVAALKSYARQGNCPGHFIEGMSCAGGCLAGPRSLVPLRKGAAKLKELMEKGR